MPHRRGFTRPRVAALIVIAIVGLGLTAYSGLSGPRPVVVPDGASPGDLELRPCSYDTEAGRLDADCGTLVVPENRRAPSSRLIALPVIRIRATGGPVLEPIFFLDGGPGSTNLSFPEASRVAERHDIVLVGYRGIDGSVTLDCPEVESALRRSADLLSAQTARRQADAFAACAGRLTGAGVDLNGYSLPQRVDDLEDARRALGYERVNLISHSAGTRTAMIYAWRHPDSLLRSVMIGVNPPGHYLWEPLVTHEQLDRYADRCRADAGCTGRTPDLARSLRETAANLPDRWGLLPIKTGNVRAAAMWGLFDTTPDAAPLNAPATIDAWLAADAGDASGLWAVSVLADLTIPGSFVWGEAASTAVADAAAVRAYYSDGASAGSSIARAANDLLWAGGRLADVWPESRDYAEYRLVRTSHVETLLVSGELDFSTPPAAAAEELLPWLPNGHHVVLTGFGHVRDFYAYDAEAGTRLLTAFFDAGQVDESGYRERSVDFEPGEPRMSTVAAVLLGGLIVAASTSLALLGWMAYRIRRRGEFGPVASALLRGLAPLLVGPGAWALAVLVGLVLAPSRYQGPAVFVAAVGLATGLCVVLAWLHRDQPGRLRALGLLSGIGAALVGARLGDLAATGPASALTTVVGAITAANLALLALDIAPGPIERRSPAPRFDGTVAAPREGLPTR